jgi:hypothetical protein
MVVVVVVVESVHKAYRIQAAAHAGASTTCNPTVVPTIPAWIPCAAAWKQRKPAIVSTTVLVQYSTAVHWEHVTWFKVDNLLHGGRRTLVGLCKVCQ